MPSIKLSVCYIDAFSVTSVSEFLNTFASAVIEGTSSTIEKRFEDIKKFINVITLSITIKDNALNSFSLDLKLRPIEQSTEEILRLPETIAQAKNIHIIVCIDEFQQLASLYGLLRIVLLLKIFSANNYRC